VQNTVSHTAALNLFVKHSVPSTNS